MSQHLTEGIRNVAFVGHGGSGKTTLAEAMLFATGTIKSQGRVDKGSTVLDYEPEEKTYQHSLSTALASLEHRGVRINIIDTPGLPDFVGRAVGGLLAAETAIVVIDAKSGPQLNTRRMFDLAKEQGLCRMIVVNRIDMEEVDLGALMKRIQDEYGQECLPINLPNKGCTQIVDCFGDGTEVETEFSSVEEAHTQILDQVVEVDDELMELYLEQGAELDPQRLHDAFESALRAGHLVPICFTAGDTGLGVTELLDVIASHLPNPREGNFVSFRSSDDLHELRAEDGETIGHVFKVVVDPFVGRLSALKLHQGGLAKDAQLYIGDARKPIKIGHVYRLQGKEHIETDEVVPGDVCAIAKIDEINYGDVLHSDPNDSALALDTGPLPTPMFGLAIEAATRGDEQKLSDALSKLCAEDPTFEVETKAALKETVIRGLGELHMRVMLERMQDRFHVQVETREPKIDYRETITANAEGHYRHKKQSGGAGQFGEVFLRVEPLARGNGFEFVDKVVGGAIPSQFIPAVEKGIKQVLEEGAIAGYPIEDVRVTVYDGKHHSVDSKEIAFVTAGKKAFVNAVKEAKPIVLEPVVNLDVTVPQDNLGDITGDLSGKRGRVAGTNMVGAGLVSVQAQAPLSELGNYQSELKSVTGGEGSFAMQFSHYDPVPQQIQSSLTAAFSPAPDDA
ncbi:MAG: elongation factor G [Pseudomonadota bacterium]